MAIDKHPIQGLMATTMENIKDMVDVNTVVGDPVTTGDGTTIIPISRVSFGFVSGGGEFNNSRDDDAIITNAGGSDELPFAGGTGAGVSVHPMGFLVVGQGQVKMLPTNYATPVDRVMELLPQVIGEIKDVFQDDDNPAVNASSTNSVTNHNRSMPVEGRTIGSSFTDHADHAHDTHMGSATYNAHYDTKGEAKQKFDTKFDNKVTAGTGNPANGVNASSITKDK